MDLEKVVIEKLGLTMTRGILDTFKNLEHLVMHEIAHHLNLECELNGPAIYYAATNQETENMEFEEIEACMIEFMALGEEFPSNIVSGRHCSSFLFHDDEDARWFYDDALKEGDLEGKVARAREIYFDLTGEMPWLTREAR